MRLNIGTTTVGIGRLKIRRSDPAVITTVKDVLRLKQQGGLQGDIIALALETKINTALADARVDFKALDDELYSGRCPRGSYYGDKVSKRWWYQYNKIDVLTEALSLLKGKVN